MKICKNQHFWIEKLNKDNIQYNLPLPTTVIGIINMIKLKIATKTAESILNTYRRYIYIEFNPSQIDQVVKIFKKPMKLTNKNTFNKGSIYIERVSYNGWKLRFNHVYKDKKNCEYSNSIDNITTNDIKKYLAMIVSHFPDINILTHGINTNDYHVLMTY